MTKQTVRQKDRRDRAAKALRAAGYVPIPRWWVTPDELDVISRMARNHDEHVNEIRGQAIGKTGQKPPFSE